VLKSFVNNSVMHFMNSFAGPNDATQVGDTRPISDKELASLKRTAGARKLASFAVASAVNGLGVLAAVYNREIVAMVWTLPTGYAIPSPKFYFVYFGVVLIVALLVPLVYILLSWRYWLKWQAEANDSFVKVHALLRVAESHARLHIWSVRCLIASLIGFVLTIEASRRGDPFDVPNVLMLLLSATLFVMSYFYQSRGLGLIFIDNALFITVKAEAATIANQVVRNSISERLEPRFKRLRPEYYF